MVKNEEKTDPLRPWKIMKLREKGVWLAEHLDKEDPIKRWGSAEKSSLYMRAKLCCSDAKVTYMADD